MIQEKYDPIAKQNQIIHLKHEKSTIRSVFSMKKLMSYKLKNKVKPMLNYLLNYF